MFGSLKKTNSARWHYWRDWSLSSTDLFASRGSSECVVHLYTILYLFLWPVQWIGYISVPYSCVIRWQCRWRWHGNVFKRILVDCSDSIVIYHYHNQGWDKQTPPMNPSKTTPVIEFRRRYRWRARSKGRDGLYPSRECHVGFAAAFDLTNQWHSRQKGIEPECAHHERCVSSLSPAVDETKSTIES